MDPEIDLAHAKKTENVWWRKYFRLLDFKIFLSPLRKQPVEGKGQRDVITERSKRASDNLIQENCVATSLFFSFFLAAQPVRWLVSQLVIQIPSPSLSPTARIIVRIGGFYFVSADLLPSLDRPPIHPGKENGGEGPNGLNQRLRIKLTQML